MTDGSVCSLPALIYLRVHDALDVRSGWDCNLVRLTHGSVRSLLAVIYRRVHDALAVRFGRVP